MAPQVAAVLLLQPQEEDGGLVGLGAGDQPVLGLQLPHAVGVEEVVEGDAEELVAAVPQVPLPVVVQLEDLHVEAVDGGEDVGGALHHDLPVLGHGQRGAVRDEHRLVPGAQGQVRVEVALHQDHLGDR